MRFGGNSCSKGLEDDSRPLENNRANGSPKASRSSGRSGGRFQLCFGSHLATVPSNPPATGPCPSSSHPARHVQLLTLSPRGFSTLGLREKCMWRLPSSLTLTATFFRVLLPQWGQKTLVMSEVVLQDGHRGRLQLPGLRNTGLAHKQDHPPSPGEHRAPVPRAAPLCAHTLT